MSDYSYNIGILKGWLFAKEAPAIVMEALSKLRELHPVARQHPVCPPSEPIIESASKAELAPEKTRRVWSEEAKAAARDRMKARIAARKESLLDRKEHAPPGEA